MTLEPESGYRWSADSIFTLSLGNAGGVQFTLNGKPLKSMGKVGAIVRNIRITREGVVSSSLPYSSSMVVRPPARQRQNETSRRSSVPSITPAETKAPPTSIPPAEKQKPIDN